jgi:short-subunit dehydrogenase
MARENIFVSVACPGAVATAIWGSQPVPKSALPAEVAADEILRGVVKREGIIVFPGRLRRGWKLYRWFPRKMDKVLMKMAR